MTDEHLGNEATGQDLDMFQRACEARAKHCDDTEEEITDWMWNHGNFLSSVFEYICPACGGPAGSCSCDED